MSNAVSGACISVDNFPISDDDLLTQQRTDGGDRVLVEELAHELRQPLSAIESLAYYLEITTESEQTRGHLEQIRFLVDRANQILREASVR
jgi:signal transduction histidine kinase